MANEVYKGYYNNTVSEFAPGSTTPTATLYVRSTPYCLAFDSSGDLYVANGDWVSEFAPGGTTPAATLGGMYTHPDAMAFNSSGNLYVSMPYYASNGGDIVNEYAVIPCAAGGVAIRSSLPTLPISLGGTQSTGSGVNLTNAELAEIHTSPGGTVTIGDSAQTGNITFTTATLATTAGASINILQNPTGPGQIILDDGAGTDTALNGNGGSISLTAGTGGIVATSTNDGAAEIAATSATVTMDTSGPIGTSSNPIQFADSVEVVIGTRDEPSSVFLDSLGSLTLGDIEGGTTNAQIEVTARTNLTVAASTTIDSGTSTLSLGADLNADGTGNAAGVGTLSIDAGALVTWIDTATNAITLRGAKVNIDTSSDPALVRSAGV